MLLNRGFTFLKCVRNSKSLQGGMQLQSIRNGYVYRSVNPPKKNEVLAAEILGGFCWWWILYHCISEPGHLFGEFPYPDPSKWTDEELGIPPDDE